MASPREAPRGPRLTNYDVVFVMKLIDAHMDGEYLVPGKGDSRESFRRYQRGLILKLRALDLDALYGREGG